MSLPIGVYIKIIQYYIIPTYKKSYILKNCDLICVKYLPIIIFRQKNVL